MEGLLNGRGDLDDKIRMLKAIGAKFISRTLVSPLDRKRWYYANNPSPTVPKGFGDEEAIRAVWAKDGAGK